MEALERELLGPWMRGRHRADGVLLHPDFMEIGSSGRVWTRDAMMMALEEDPGRAHRHWRSSARTVLALTPSC